MAFVAGDKQFIFRGGGGGWVVMAPGIIVIHQHSKNFGSPFKIAVLRERKGFGIVADLVFWENLFHLFHHPNNTQVVIVTLVYKEWKRLGVAHREKYQKVHRSLFRCQRKLKISPKIGYLDIRSGLWKI